MISQPQDLEFRNNPENFHACYFEDSARILFLETTNQQTFENAIVYLFVLILYIPSTIFQLHRDGSSWVEPVLS